MLVALSLAGCGGGNGTSATLQDGITAQVAGHLAQADSDFLAVIKRNPREKVAWYDLGVIAQLRGLAPQAQHDYLQALGIDPRYVPALYNLALVESNASPPTAIKLFSEVVADQPDLAAAHYNLGVLLERQGSSAQGQAELTRARQLDPRLVPPATTPPQPTRTG